VFDYIIIGGSVLDGSGQPGIVADVAIRDGRVAAVGALAEAESRSTVDATGHIVAPGFIDIHSHSDFTLLVDGRAESQLAQGVTTEVVGNCGHGCAPFTNTPLMRTNIYGYAPDLTIDWDSVDGYLSRLQGARPAVNVATLVPNGNLRIAALESTDRPATRAEVNRMATLLREGLSEGAFGFSTGLEYPVERHASAEELLALCRVTAQEDKLYATHTRNRDVQAVEAIQEAIDVARQSGARLEISHLIPRRAGNDKVWEEALAVVDRAQSQGLDLTFDSHTRLHGITNLSTALPPSEANLPAVQLRNRLLDRSARQSMRSYPSIISSFGLGGWERVTLFSSKATPDKVGINFKDLADGGDPMDVVYDILAANAADPHSVMVTCHTHDEGWLRGTFSHPLCMPGSDATALCTTGPLASSSFLGAYTWAGWYLRRIVRECKDLSLEEGIRRLTAMPAERVGLKQRGRLAPDYWADIVIFNADEVADQGTLQTPNLLASGVRDVFVNGVKAMNDGVFTEARTGRVIRSGHSSNG